jgi:hypothetical protein
MPTLKMFPNFSVHQARMRYFYDLYYPSTLPSILSFTPSTLGVPLAAHRDLWDLLMKCMPTAANEVWTFLRAYAEKQLHSVTSKSLAGDVLRYDIIKLGHQYPDARAHALLHSHCILWVEFCRSVSEAHTPEVLVQAAVHPSERGHLLHYPTFSLGTSTTSASFSPSLHTCSCEVGCDFMIVWFRSLLVGITEFVRIFKCFLLRFSM